MARANQPTRPVAAGPTGLPRLLPPNPSTDLRGHLAEYGSIPPSSIHVVDHVRAAGLLGRGGAGFPTGTKMAAVAQRGRRPIIVANGTEGEPASAKDKVLMTHSPHLVLDGISIAAAALDATDAVLCIDRSDHGIVALMEHAISERNTAGVDRVPLRLEIAPDRYVAGEETALVHWLNGGEAKPTTTPPRPFEKGVRGRPTLVDNVETLANVALIARYGADWFRTIGPKSEPGSLLLTVSGHVTTPGVLEVASGSSFHEILSHVGGRIDETEAFLVGGYFGAWMPRRA
jgi:NADH:ubiquinone oxidoreductase subunit F (NADH-binding)